MLCLLYSSKTIHFSLITSKMNYIKHLTGFFIRIAAEETIYPTHISLYLALFQSWNINRFKNPIAISRDEMMKTSRRTFLTGSSALAAAAVSQTVKTKSITGASGCWKSEMCFERRSFTAWPLRRSLAAAAGRGGSKRICSNTLTGSATMAARAVTSRPEASRSRTPSASCVSRSAGEASRTSAPLARAAPSASPTASPSGRPMAAGERIGGLHDGEEFGRILALFARAEAIADTVPRR